MSCILYYGCLSNWPKFVSKIDLLHDLNVENSETNSTVENGVNEFNEYLQNLRIETSGNLLIGHLNINSIRNKVDMLSYMIGNQIDILMRWPLSLKLWKSFPEERYSRNWSFWFPQTDYYCYNA